MSRRQINHKYKPNTWMHWDNRNQNSKYGLSEQQWYRKQGTSQSRVMGQMLNDDAGNFGYRESAGRQNESNYQQMDYYKEREPQMTKCNGEAVSKGQENDTERRREWKEYQNELIKTMKEHIKEETDKIREEIMRQRENFLMPQQPVLYQMHPNIHPPYG